MLEDVWIFFTPDHGQWSKSMILGKTDYEDLPSRVTVQHNRIIDRVITDVCAHKVTPDWWLMKREVKLYNRRIFKDSSGWFLAWRFSTQLCVVNVFRRGAQTSLLRVISGSLFSLGLPNAVLVHLSCRVFSHWYISVRNCRQVWYFPTDFELNNDSSCVNLNHSLCNTLHFYLQQRIRRR